MLFAVDLTRRGVKPARPDDATLVVCKGQHRQIFTAILLIAYMSYRVDFFSETPLFDSRSTAIGIPEACRDIGLLETAKKPSRGWFHGLYVFVRMEAVFNRQTGVTFLCPIFLRIFSAPAHRKKRKSNAQLSLPRPSVFARRAFYVI